MRTVDAMTTRSAPSPAHRRRALAGLALAAGLVLAGCASSAGESGTEASTSTTKAPAADGPTTTKGPGTSTTDLGGASTTLNTTPPTAPPNTTPPTIPPNTTPPTPPTTPPAATPLTPAQAEAKVREQGDWDVDLSTYDPAATLSAVEAVAAGAGSSAAPEQIYFVSKGTYLGPATSSPRLASSFEQTSDDTVTVTYGHYAPTDPFCCPSQPAWTVVFRYVGGKLTTSGEIPAEGQGL